MANIFRLSVNHDYVPIVYTKIFKISLFLIISLALDEYFIASLITVKYIEIPFNPNNTKVLVYPPYRGIGVQGNRDSVS